MPQFGSILLLCQYLLAQPLAAWLMFPCHIKTHGHPCGKQKISLIILNLLRAVMGVGYSTIPKLPLVKQQSWQIGLCILFPVFKKFNMWWLSKLALKASEGEIQKSSLMTIICVGFHHSFSLALLLSSNEINKATAYMVMCSDFIFNTWSFLKIIKNTFE